MGVWQFWKTNIAKTTVPVLPSAAWIVHSFTIMQCVLFGPSPIISSSIYIKRCLRRLIHYLCKITNLITSLFQAILNSPVTNEYWSLNICIYIQVWSDNFYPITKINIDSCHKSPVVMSFRCLSLQIHGICLATLVLLNKEQIHCLATRCKHLCHGCVVMHDICILFWKPPNQYHRLYWSIDLLV